MKKRKKKKNNFIYIYVLVIVLSIALIFFEFLIIKNNKNMNKIESILKDSFSFPTRIFSKNVELNISESVTNLILSESNKEVLELKELLDLNIVNTSFEYINATVINRNSLYWYDTLTIDKGKNDGIKTGMAVINSNGFIGEVNLTSDNTSEIKLITSPKLNKKISVKINDEYGVITKYDSKEELFTIEGITNLENIEKNDKVITSGLTSLYPLGLLIGTVEKIEENQYGIDSYVLAKLSSNIKETHYLSVIKK